MALSKDAPFIEGTYGKDYLSGVAGGSTLAGGAGDDIYFVLSRDDVVSENANEGIDSVVTWRTSYSLGANVENLSVLGNDLVGVGNDLDNRLSGGDGRQTLVGGGGNDTLSGGAGNDVFVVEAGSGSDTITDFASGDVVKLGSYGFKTFSEVTDRMTQDGSNVVLKLNGGETLTFQNKSIADFKQADFHYALDTSHLTQTFNEDFDQFSLQSSGGTWRTWHAVNQGSHSFLSPDNDFGVNPFSLDQGVLTIHADTANDAVKSATGKDYTSGLLSTRDSFSQTYGYFEMRADLPSKNGVCPAFWLLRADGTWPPELDVMEQIGNDPTKVYQTAHTNSTGEHTKTAVSSWVGDTGEGMHTYGLLWTKEELVWYVDGVEAFRTATPADMHEPMYMVASMSVDNDWAGKPDADFNGADFKIDYIRAYQLNDELGTRKIITGSKWSITLDKDSDGLVLTGDFKLNGTGNALDNTLTGNDADNVLDGRGGADTMDGHGGNDTYIVDNAGDVVIEKANQGTDIVQSSISYVLSDNVETLILTGGKDIHATGNERDNTIYGNSGNNVINGAAGLDTMLGGAGDDIYYVDDVRDVVTEWSNGGIDTVYASVSFRLASQVENLTLTGSENLSATGNWMDNILIGNAGDNVISGDGGADRMIGGLGNDTYSVDSTKDIVIENANEGIDTVISTASFVLGENVENLVLTGNWTNSGTGNALDNRITGSAGSNILDGRAGADTMIGAAGDDSYIVDNASDVVIERANEGTDRVVSTLSYTLGANVENLTLAGSGNIDATGNGGANRIVGNVGANVINGGAGADIMAGDLGNDTYFVDEARDTVIEWSNGGTDTIYSTVSFALGNNIEILALTGTANINAFGSWDNNTLIGNSGNNILDGSKGADLMIGGAGNDTYFVDSVKDAIRENADEGTDTVNVWFSYALGANVENLTLFGDANLSGTGNELNNLLLGNGGSNLLDGGAGIDTMSGGLGNDTYIVDNAGDVVTEWSNCGIDTVRASVSYTLSTQVENLTLTGITNINATGNWMDNVLTGNAGDNVLMGGGGNDRLVGGLGNDSYYIDNAQDVVVENAGGGVDTIYTISSTILAANVENLVYMGQMSATLTGNELDNMITGNDLGNILDGAAGADRLVGGAGNDVYIVDNANDTVVELAGGGTDTVKASVSHALADNIETLLLTGVGDIAATGNSLNNLIYGNDGANTIDGAGGDDALYGGAGNDTYLVDSQGDTVVEWSMGGIDTVVASVSYALGNNVENLTLAGTADIGATGNGLANILIGNDGANTLVAGGGNDILEGGRGADMLTGGQGNDSFVFRDARDSVAGGADTITDFAAGDVIDLSNLFVGTLSFLGTSAFTGHAGEAQVATVSGGVMLSIDLGGDGVADSQIFLANAKLTGSLLDGSGFVF